MYTTCCFFSSSGGTDVRRLVFWRPICASAAAATLTCATLAGDNPACTLDAGLCFEEHETVGCGIPECCNLVCDLDPACCLLEWDAICVDLAIANCPVCPGKGDCFEANGSPGCINATCCELICAIDGFCCGTDWDQICADEAMLLCDGKMCDAACPKGAIIETDACGEDTNGGCNLDERGFETLQCGDTFCGTIWADGNRDTDWFEVSVAEQTLLRLTVTSEFPSELLMVGGDCDLGFTVLARSNGLDCQAASVELCVEPGAHLLFVSTGTEQAAILDGIPCEDDPKNKDPILFGNAYTATVECLTCPAEPCPWDLDGDDGVGPADLIVLLGAWGTDPGGPPDFDGDGDVDPADLIELLGHWGPCP